MRALVVIALALFLAGVAAAGPAGRATASPIAVGGVFEAPGALFSCDSSHGRCFQFLPNRKFAVGISLQNVSRKPVVVTGADALEPPRTLVHQIGARFHAWSPPNCDGGGVPCPPKALRIGSAKVVHPHPFTVAPGHYVGVELDFRLGSCADVPRAVSAPISRLRVAFREQNSAARPLVLQLGADALALRMPKPEDCAFPRSRLAVYGSGQYSGSWYFTVPGSKGDVCTRRGGLLRFTSRAYRISNVRREEIEIFVPHFAGNGTYRRATAEVVVGGRTKLRLKGTITVTRATSSVVVGKVDAGEPRTIGKVVPHILGRMRCRVVR